MMLVSHLAAVLAAAAPAACPAPTSADAVAAEGVVRRFFREAAADRIDAAQALLAPGFYAFDAGRRFDGAELTDAVKSAHADGTTLEWNLGPMDVHTDCTTAWASWINRGRVGKAPDLRPATWQESAVLERVGAAWKVRFLHSNRITEPAS